MFDIDSDSAFTQSKEARNYVKFYRQWVRNNFKSEQEGREVGDYADYIMVVSPGQPKSEVRRKASDADKMAYRAEWMAYEAGKEHIEGTPIEVLPGLPSGMADMLKSLYIHTIEQMANLSDLGMQKIGMGANDLRNKCRAYLDKNTTEVAALKARIAELEAELKNKSKPGRKPKMQVAA